MKKILLVIPFLCVLAVVLVFARSKLVVQDNLVKLTPLAKITPTQTVSVPKTTILVTGDVMLGRSVNTRINKYKDVSFPFRKTRDLLNSADITLINLENPLVDPCPITDTGMIFCAPTTSVEGLQWAGVDVANIANNHINNYGQDGYKSTLTTLDVSGIKPSDSDHFILIPKNNLMFGFVGFDLVGKRWKNEDVARIVKQAKSWSDVLVVSFHWGAEYQNTQGTSQIEYGHLAVDNGADLVIGTHPHVIQPIEEYKGVPIVYSLGNFIFDQMWSEDTKKGLVIKFTFEGTKLVGQEEYPIKIIDYGQAIL